MGNATVADEDSADDYLFATRIVANLPVIRRNLIAVNAQAVADALAAQFDTINARFDASLMHIILYYKE